MNYLYLHGFASGPQSVKAVDLRDRFAARGIDLKVPDLNQPDFFNLTLTRQIQQCEAILAADSGAWTIVGSSLGGLTATWLAQRNLKVERLVLLAPAFEFLAYWQQQLGSTQLEQWETDGSLDVYHHAAERSLPLGYSFWADASQYSDAELDRATPTLILHGTADEVIPLEASRRYSAQRSWCTLVELPSDHGLTDRLPEIWEATQHFCGVV
ncbi:YqiA/YcfP family alpha/beta fold hydrolase [Altericista sp. CCNU0014]|uniref:YqiA/YcfP family alpha/beta fold hydrolase n=1 Tax=Altericista sp. CCNU0014 TaxID=3082949 RepID=UPI00384DC69D